VNKSTVKFNNIESLIYGGAFDNLGDRRECLRRLYELSNAKKPTKQKKLFKSPTEEKIMMRFRDPSGSSSARSKTLREISRQR
jgi:DNA polymerase III alpha subunit